MIYIVLDKQKAFKTILSSPLHSNLKKIQGLQHGANPAQRYLQKEHWLSSWRLKHFRIRVQNEIVSNSSRAAASFTLLGKQKVNISLHKLLIKKKQNKANWSGFATNLWRASKINGVTRILMSPTKRNNSVASLRDLVDFLRVLTGEYSELELADVRSGSLMAEFQRVLRLESRSLVSKTPELKKGK